jgi:hypothetical protein
MEYLVTMTTHVPDGTSEETVDDIRTREAALAGTGGAGSPASPVASSAGTRRMAHDWTLRCR